MKILEGITGFLYPPKCAFCNEVLQVGAELEVCESCAAKMPFFMYDYLIEGDRSNAAASFNGVFVPEAPAATSTGSDTSASAGNSGSTGCDRLICALRYTHMVKKALMKIKFSQRAELGRTFGAILAEKVRRVEGDGVFDIVTAVPAGKQRERERGYNQAGVIAGYMAKYLDLDFDAELLLKLGGSLRQSGLSRVERYRNAKRSFGLNTAKANLIKGQAILLVDDISTTFSTIDACAALLKEGGAVLVVGAVVASGLTEKVMD